MSKHPVGRPARAVWTVGMAVAALLLGACSAADNDTSDDTSGDTTERRDGVDALYAGTYGEPPGEAPKAKTSLDLWVVSCGQVATACADSAAAAGEAGEALGWSSQTCDGELNPGVWSQCIRQGVAAKADAVLVVGVDCAAVQQSLVEADSAGVPVVGIFSADCDDPDIGGKPLFAASTVPSAETPTIGEYYEAIGRARAEWITADSEGAASIVEVNFEGTATGARHHQGFVDGIAACTDCQLVEAAVTNDTIGNLRGIVETALLKNPEATYVVVPLDSLTLLGASQAVAASTRRNDITVVGGEGAAPVMDLLRAKRGVDVVLGQSAAWWGYAGVDTVIRTLAGEDPVAQGLGFQLVDRSSDLPEAGKFEPSIDFRDAYLEAWGVGA